MPEKRRLHATPQYMGGGFPWGISFAVLALLGSLPAGRCFQAEGLVRTLLQKSCWSSMLGKRRLASSPWPCRMSAAGEEGASRDARDARGERQEGKSRKEKISKVYHTSIALIPPDGAWEQVKVALFLPHPFLTPS